MCRCQSASSVAHHRRGLRPSNKSRSHSGPARTKPRQPSCELPIPSSSSCQGGRRDQRRGPLGAPDDRDHQEEKRDLTKMYDYATWNMYERIVNARRQRLLGQGQGAEPRAPQRQQTRSASPTKAPPANGQAAAAGGPGSFDTGRTADETDRSSTASSSWSRADSPGTFPPVHAAGGGGGSFLPMFDPPLPAGDDGLTLPHRDDAAEEESFIFQLDM